MNLRNRIEALEKRADQLDPFEWHRLRLDAVDFLTMVDLRSGAAVMNKTRETVEQAWDSVFKRGPLRLRVIDGHRILDSGELVCTEEERQQRIDNIAASELSRSSE